MKTFSLVIPVFNEEETLGYSFTRLKDALALKEFERFSKIEMIFVNDGSRDQSARILGEIAERESNERLQIQVLHFSRNFGHSNAVLAGLQHSTGEIVGIIDADLQDPPECLAPMVAEIDQGYDVVYGQRLKREKETFFKKITAWGFYRTLNMLTGLPIPNDTGDFRVMRREVLESLLQCGEPDPFLRGLVAWVGYRQKAYAYIRESRKYGTTKYPLRKMMRFATHAILNFSIKPLHLAIYAAFIVFFLCIGLIVWALATHFSGQTVPGWTSLLIAFLLGQSVVLFVLGVMGLYIGQVHVGVQGRPRYIVRKSDTKKSDQ